MIIDYQHIEEQLVEKFKGGEGHMCTRGFVDDGQKIMFNRLTPGSSIGYHCHERNTEIMYILSGHGHYDMDGTREEIQAGQVHYCPMGHSHAMYNDGDDDLVFFAVVTKEV